MLLMPRTQKAFNEKVKNLTSKKQPTARSRKKEAERITFSKTKDENLFPHGESFVFRFEDRRKNPELNLAWFRDFWDVSKHVERYGLKKKDYRIFKKV